MDKMTAFTTSNYRLDEQAAELHDAAMTLQTALYGESQLYSLTDLLSDAAREISRLYKVNRHMEELATRQASTLRTIAGKGLGNYKVGDATGYHDRLQRMVRVGDVYSYIDNEGNVTEAPIVYDYYECDFMHDGVKLSYALKYDDEFHYVKGGETNDNNDM